MRAHASVVGGTTAPIGSWPFAAFIADVTDGTACSGTVVSPMLVLTAAHCVENISSGAATAPAAFRVVTGSLDWTNRASGQVLGVSRVAIDPTFDATTLDDDAALLVLATPTSAPAIELASPTENSLTQAGTPAQLAGWGYTYVGEPTPPTVLYQGSTVVQSAVHCAEQETLDGVLYDPAENLCAADTPSFAVSACHGDSGGPLVATAAGGEEIEIGITSHGDPNCNPDYPSVFTRADAVSGWVASVIAADAGAARAIASAGHRQHPGVRRVPAGAGIERSVADRSPREFDAAAVRGFQRPHRAAGRAPPADDRRGSHKDARRDVHAALRRWGKAGDSRAGADRRRRQAQWQRLVVRRGLQGSARLALPDSRRLRFAHARHRNTQRHDAQRRLPGARRALERDRLLVRTGCPRAAPGHPSHAGNRSPPSTS